MKLYIVEIDPSSAAVFAKLKREGRVPADVELITGSAFSVAAEALVSPANSLGIMRGGFDGFIASKIPGIEGQVRAAIYNCVGDYFIPVGQSKTIDIDFPTFKKLIIAPTMARPGMPGSLTAVRMAARAIFQNNRNLQSITMTPLGTGVGGLDLEESVSTILKVYQEVC